MATKNPTKTDSISKLKALVVTPAFGMWYAIGAVVLLAASTLLWATLGAQVNQGNADQLVDVYMMSDPSTLSQAVFPGAHTFLFKWPLFALVQVFGATPLAFLVATVAVSLATVGVLAYVLFRIERRPLLFGTICLALASALFLVPIQPYPGALLPVNMAMITTRNLEYVLYLLSLILLARATNLKSKRFWAGVAVLGILGASDKLFLILSVGGAGLALSAYALARQWEQVQMTARWLVAGVVAALFATALLFALDGRLTHLHDAANVAPYQSARTIPEFLNAAAYGVIGFFTNFGANPAFDVTIIKDMPARAVHYLFSLGGPALLVNLAVVLVGSWLTVRVTLQTMRQKQKADDPTKLSLMLVWSSVAAIGAFMLSAHYYPVDARYITIVVFAVFIAAATWVRTMKFPAPKLVLAGLIAGIAMVLAIPTVLQAGQASSAALATVNGRNKLIAQALQQHPVDALVGDYWRVVPTKLNSKDITVVPLSACTTLQEALTSKKWQVDLNTHSFSYLLTLDGSLTGYEPCTLDRIVEAYGKPNSSTLIAGSLSSPLELLLFYDKGAHKSSPATLAQQLTSLATVLPITSDQLPYLTCHGPTDMNIVAHQDDDLLFMNPDILKGINDGHCVRTVYMTAGDAGGDSYYWIGREHGIEAAYSKMIGSDAVWIERIVQLGDNRFATVANPKGNSKISLIFLHLPDGSPSGRGFNASHEESLDKLETGKIPTLHSVDHQSHYTADELTSSLVDLMRLYQPALVRTQSADTGKQFPDHSDHNAVGRFATKAHGMYVQQQFEGKIAIPLIHYTGYPVHSLPENVSGDDLKQKTDIFLTYAAYDSSVCHTQQQCDNKAVYGLYLRRQYTQPQ